MIEHHPLFLYNRSTPMEIWKTIPNFSHYEVSTLGRIRHRVHKVVRKLKRNKDGYLVIAIKDDFRARKTIPLHRLVALAFIKNENQLKTVDHINRCRSDNRLENLRWSSHRENMLNREFLTSLERIKTILQLNEQGLSAKEIFTVLIRG